MNGSNKEGFRESPDSRHCHAELSITFYTQSVSSAYSLLNRDLHNGFQKPFSCSICGFMSGCIERELGGTSFFTIYAHDEWGTQSKNYWYNIQWFCIIFVDLLVSILPKPIMYIIIWILCLTVYSHDFIFIFHWCFFFFILNCLQDLILQKMHGNLWNISEGSMRTTR